MQIDLNCDMGEGFGVYPLGADEALMPLFTSANIACGFHAGDPVVLDRTVALAKQYGVAVGAHPGYPDLAGFGRRGMNLSPLEIQDAVLYQIGALSAFCRAHQVALVHVKAHGALYNSAATDAVVAQAIARGAASFDRQLVLVGLASSQAMAAAAAQAGLLYAAEAFADRTYNPDGTLQSRQVPGSLITDTERCARQAVGIVHGRLLAYDGTELRITAQTICLHGDNPSAVPNALAVRSALSAAGVTIARMSPG